MIDVIVVGSGAGAVHAAWPLVQRGLRVVMLDFGNVDREYAPLIPERPWSELRRGDAEQYRYFLGDRFEGIAFGGVRVGAQLTPPRLFIPRDTERLQPVRSDTFSVTQSLAKGGLAAGWGAGVFPFDDDDLAGTPFTRSTLQPHYDAVAERVGVCGGGGDLFEDLGECPSLLPDLEIDSGAEYVLARYESKRTELQRRGLRLGKTRLAVCSTEHRGRGPHPHLDMDFWADARRSVYRAGWTVDELEAFENFEYRPGRLVVSFTETPDGGVEGEPCVEVVSRVDDGGEERLRAGALVVAAGAIGSARIVLRSLGCYGRSVPILCNPYTYAPVVNVGMIGREPRDRRHSLAQLTAVYRSPGGGPPVLAQYYSYRSLLTFKLVKESPLGTRESLRLMRMLIPVMGIVGVHHEDRPSPDKTLVLRASPGGDAPDEVEIDYRPSADEERRHRRIEKELSRLFRTLGCWPIKRVDPGHGSNIHYAGTLPYSSRGEELTTDADGRLSGSRAVYLADGAVFPSIPAKGLTFTIMANADRVGARLAERLG